MTTTPPVPHSTRVTRRAALAASTFVAIAPAALAACGTDSGGGASDGPVELTFLNQSRGQEKVLTKLAEQYSSEHGITITVDSPGPADYLPKLQSRAQSGSMPDIYSSFSASDMAAFYKAGWAMDLSDELEKGWKDDFSPAILSMSTFAEGNSLDLAPGVYTVHWETQTYGLLVNPTLTGIAADSAPATTADLITALGAAPEATGKFLIASSLVPQLLQTLVSAFLSDDEIAATYRGEASWEDEAWAKSLQFLVDATDAGVLANGALPGGQDDNPTVEGDFFTGSLGVIFDASPGVAVGLTTNPEFQDYISIPVPAIEGGTLDPRSAGVPGKGAVINPKGKHPEEALAFVKWLTEPPQQKVFAEEARILPTSPKLLAGGDVPQQLTGFAAAVDGMQTFSETWVVDVKTSIVSEAQRVVLGEVTVAEALATIQATQERFA